MNRRSGITVVEATIVVAILLLLAAIALPAFFQNQTRKRAAECGMALEASLEALVPDYLPQMPVCPSGGTYTLGTPEGDPPACSIPGHTL